MDWQVAKERQSEALMRFVVMLFAIAGFHTGALSAGRQFTFFPQNSWRLQALAMAEKRKLCPDPHLRSAFLWLLHLARAAFWLRGRANLALGCRRLDLPDILPREPHELLTAQNMAQRWSELDRELDDLFDQAGRLVRWRAKRDSDDCLFSTIGPQQVDSPRAGDKLLLASGKNYLPLDCDWPSSDAPAFHDTS